MKKRAAEDLIGFMTGDALRSVITDSNSAFYCGNDHARNVSMLNDRSSMLPLHTQTEALVEAVEQFGTERFVPNGFLFIATRLSPQTCSHLLVCFCSGVEKLKCLHLTFTGGYYLGRSDIRDLLELPLPVTTPCPPG
jgi:hypothetical protein